MMRVTINRGSQRAPRKQIFAVARNERSGHPVWAPERPPPSGSTGKPRSAVPLRQIGLRPLQADSYSGKTAYNTLLYYALRRSGERRLNGSLLKSRRRRKLSPKSWAKSRRDWLCRILRFVSRRNPEPVGWNPDFSSLFPKLCYSSGFLNTEAWREWNRLES